MLKLARIFLVKNNFHAKVSENLDNRMETWKENEMEKNEKRKDSGMALTELVADWF